MSSIDSSFGVDYAMNEKSWCKECKQPIPKNELRMSIRAPSDVHGGAEDNWFHFHCFWNIAAKDEQICERNIYRIELLKWNDQEKIRQKIAESEDLLNSCDPSSSYSQLKSEEGNKKRKSLEAVSIPEKKQKFDNSSSDLQAKLKKQTDTYCYIRDELTETLSVEQAIQLIKANDRYKRKNDGDREVFEHLTDCIVFGVPERCTKCSKRGGVLFYCPSQHTYRCNGKASAYASCQYRDRNPLRIPLKVPSGFDRSQLFFELHDSPMIRKRCYSSGLDFVGMIKPVSSPLIEKYKKRLSLPESVEKPFVKNGCIIDGRAYFAKYSSVFTDTDGTLCQAYLGFSDISRNLNNFYKIQLFKHDKKVEYYLYRSWGRIGSPGGLKLECFNKDIDRALKEFKRIFFEKTGNLWENRKTFVKHPCLHDIVEMEVVEKDCSSFQSFDVNTSKSKLPVPIKELIGSLFDMKIMKESLMAMNVDLQKMPLGKISKTNIMKAMFILKQLESYIRDGASSITILELSNQFYTLIPHACMSQAPSLLDNDKIIHEKTQLLIDLFQIEVAFSFIDDSQNDKKEADPIDKYYEKLHCKIEVLPTDTPEFEIIQSYLFQNHAPTRTEYSLEIIKVFKIERDGEETRFKRNIGNRNLLWHGSKTSNFAGILSQGLRIAPPEAPANGYMFGKGIYFADMVSKSANYCGITDGEGYLLLSEVALGQIQEERHSDDQIKKPSKGKSSVKGLGQIVPNKLRHKVTKDGINVPIGEPIVRKNGFRNYPLVYNEYVVYDEAQVKMKYLIKAKFNSK